MTAQHRELAAGRWYELSLAEQLGNIGSEVHRAVSWRGRDDEYFRAAFERAIELIDLTLADPRLRHRLKEVARLREVFCDAVAGGETYCTKLEDIDRYLLQFALAAHLRR